MIVWNSRRIIKSKVGRKMAETEKQKDIYILGIESSCDETAASVVKNGREVLSNVISSQIALHTLYGGVVPEIASRKHIEKSIRSLSRRLPMPM
jgi:N6-L-threonylcarbamoyladenine synthase